MKMIVIAEKRFDELFEKCLDKMKMAQTGVSGSNVGDDLQTVLRTENMHRTFHFYICALREDLKNG